jgi:hypothetical protein
MMPVLATYRPIRRWRFRARREAASGGSVCVIFRRAWYIITIRCFHFSTGIIQMKAIVLLADRFIAVFAAKA